jgi:hypothetical protein
MINHAFWPKQYLVAALFPALLVLGFSTHASACPLVRAENFNWLQQSRSLVRARFVSDPIDLWSARRGPAEHLGAAVVLETLAGEPLAINREIEFRFHDSWNRSLWRSSAAIFATTGAEVLLGLTQDLDPSHGAEFVIVSDTCDSVGIIPSSPSYVKRATEGFAGKYCPPDRNGCPQVYPEAERPNLGWGHLASTPLRLVSRIFRTACAFLWGYG